MFVPYETGSYDRDYEQELKDELDNLSNLMDQLSDGEMVWVIICPTTWTC